jgi:hypothetical protein
MTQAFNGTINVGGIQYTLDPSKVGVNYLFRSYKEFREIFESISARSHIPLDRITQLFVTYFRVEPFVEQDFGAIKQKDKTDLIKIFNAYLEYLKTNKAMSGNSIVSIMLDRTYYNIVDILNQLNGGPKDYSKMDVQCQSSKALIRGLTPERKREMIAEFTWLLKYPGKIRSKEGCEWAKMAASVADIKLTDMTAQLNSDKDNKEDKEDKKNGEETQHGGNDSGIESRFKSLLIVSNILALAKKNGYDHEEGYKDLEKAFSDTIMALFNNIKKMYKPIYGVIENCMKRNRVKKNKIIIPLLQLQHLSNHFIGNRKEPYGIYRIRHSEKRLVSYLTSQLQCISSTLEKMKPADQRKYHDVQKELTPVSPISLPKRKAVASSKKEVVLPVVQFATLDGNLTIPPFEQFYRKGSETEKEQFYQVMTDFFTKDNIYMIYSESDEVPLNFYDISLESVDTADSYIPITEYDPKRIIKNHVLQDFCTFVPHATYTNAELVLSIFIALKEKRTK